MMPAGWHRPATLPCLYSHAAAWLWMQDKVVLQLHACMHVDAFYVDAFYVDAYMHVVWNRNFALLWVNLSMRLQLVARRLPCMWFKQRQQIHVVRQRWAYTFLCVSFVSLIVTH